jgi:hypothetical protein
MAPTFKKAKVRVMLPVRTRCSPVWLNQQANVAVCVQDLAYNPSLASKSLGSSSCSTSHHEASKAAEAADDREALLIALVRVCGVARASCLLSPPPVLPLLHV